MRYKEIVETKIQNLYHVKFIINESGLTGQTDKIIEILKKENDHSLKIAPRKIQIIIDDSFEDYLKSLGS